MPLHYDARCIFLHLFAKKKKNAKRAPGRFRREERGSRRLFLAPVYPRRILLPHEDPAAWPFLKSAFDLETSFPENEGSTRRSKLRVLRSEPCRCSPLLNCTNMSAKRTRSPPAACSSFKSVRWFLLDLPLILFSKEETSPSSLEIRSDNCNLSLIHISLLLLRPYTVTRSLPLASLPFPPQSCDRFTFRPKFHNILRFSSTFFALQSATFSETIQHHFRSF